MADASIPPQPTGNTVKPSRRRDKPQLSCNLCRRRKLKCDRAQPCGTCARRGLSLSCTYVQPKAPELRGQGQGQGQAQGQGQTYLPSSIAMQERIAQLEGLLMSLMNKMNDNSIGLASTQSSDLANLSTMGNQLEDYSFTPVNDSARLSDKFGRISLENAETSYVENNHWTAIIDGIAELKDYFEDEQDSPESNTSLPENSDMDEPELVFGFHKMATKEEILAALPPRSIVDRLVAVGYTMDMAPAVIHGPTFLKKYEEFWQNPSETPIMWIGLLYAAICLAYMFQFVSNGDIEGKSPQQMLEFGRTVHEYREKTTQCLILGKYTKCPQYTIETLLLYLNIEYSRKEDSQISTWILIGIIVRLSFKMGYHRDGSLSPNITPFQAEMRRRNWNMIVQFDAMSSAHVGLPRMIRESQTDTKDPSNLLDEDFDENITELPPARPEKDQTPIQFIVAKKNLLSVFGMINDLTTTSHTPAYTEVMRLDKLLHDTFNGLPVGLQMKPLAKSIMDSPLVILRRIFLILSFHKCQCILHRRYLLPARTDSRYTYSRTSCIEGALALLQYQKLLNEETQSDGRLVQEKWKVSSLIKQEFLLGTTILALDLDHDMKSGSFLDPRQTTSDTEMRQQIIQALSISYRIWQASSDSSQDAQKVTRVLRVVLTKAQMMKSTTIPNPTAIPTNQSAFVSNSNTTSPDDFMKTRSTPSGSSTAVSSTASTAPTDSTSFIPSDEINFNDFPDMSVDDFDMINWDLGDQPQGFEDFLDMSPDELGRY